MPRDNGNAAGEFGCGECVRNFGSSQIFHQVDASDCQANKIKTVIARLAEAIQCILCGVANPLDCHVALLLAMTLPFSMENLGSSDACMGEHSPFSRPQVSKQQVQNDEVTDSWD